MHIRHSCDEAGEQRGVAQTLEVRLFPTSVLDLEVCQDKSGSRIS